MAGRGPPAKAPRGWNPPTNPPRPTGPPRGGPGVRPVPAGFTHARYELVSNDTRFNERVDLLQDGLADRSYSRVHLHQLSRDEALGNPPEHVLNPDNGNIALPRWFLAVGMHSIRVRAVYLKKC